jgi:hypothetical protein
MKNKNQDHDETDVATKTLTFKEEELVELSETVLEQIAGAKGGGTTWGCGRTGTYPS